MAIPDLKKALEIYGDQPNRDVQMNLINVLLGARKLDEAKKSKNWLNLRTINQLSEFLCNIYRYD